MNLNIFNYIRNNDVKKEAPLAARMRPGTLEEVVARAKETRGMYGSG